MRVLTVNVAAELTAAAAAMLKPATAKNTPCIIESTAAVVIIAKPPATATPLTVFFIALGSVEFLKN